VLANNEVLVRDISAMLEDIAQRRGGALVAQVKPNDEAMVF
jgi:hypothetical protein